MTKRTKLLALAKKRQATRWPGYNSELKTMHDVVYKLQWLESGEWVFDRQ